MLSLIKTISKYYVKGVRILKKRANRRTNQMDMRVRRNAAILDRAGREITLENGNKIYVVRSAISSSKEDSYSTKMGQSSLDLFVRQANDGVPVCPNHTKEVITGYTSNAEQAEDGIVSCDLNIDVDLPFAHPEAGYPNSDVLIRQLKANRIKMASVGGGFNSETQLICNLDGKDMMSDMSCIHWQGVKYEMEVKESDTSDKLVKREIKCVPSWEHLDLGEVSTVYAGANGDANIVATRADLMLEKGLLNKSVAARLNRIYGLSIDLTRAKPDKTIIDLGANNGEDTTMNAEEIAQLQADKVAAEARATAAETAKAALEGDSQALAREKQDVRKDCLVAYKDFRGENITGQDLIDFEKTLDKLELHEMKVQREILVGESSSEEENGGDDNSRVQPGRRSSDKDRSQGEDNDDLKNSRGQMPPRWFGASRAKNVVP